MGQTTGISWAHSTWNPIRSCVEVSAACDHCYAREMAKRNPKVLGVWGSEADGGTRVVAATDYWKEPSKWNKAAATEGVRKRVFCASMADFFESWSGLMMDHKGQVLLKPYLDSESQPQNWIGEPLGIEGKLDKSDMQGWRPVTMDDVRKRAFNEVIDVTPNLDYLLLTKRPQNIRSMTYGVLTKLDSALKAESETPDANIWHRSNVWIGTTVESQEYADKRIPELLRCRGLSPVLWLSVEPMLSEICLGSFLDGQSTGFSGREDGIGVSGNRLCFGHGGRDGLAESEESRRERGIVEGSANYSEAVRYWKEGRIPCSASECCGRTVHGFGTQDRMDGVEPKPHSAGNGGESQRRVQVEQQYRQSGSGDAINECGPCPSHSRAAGSPSAEGAHTDARTSSSDKIDGRENGARRNSKTLRSFEVNRQAYLKQTHVGLAQRWVIAGCESGRNARPTELDWVRSLRDQCQAAGVAFFVKQLHVNGRLVKQLEDFPPDLQIQEVPEPCH